MTRTEKGGVNSEWALRLKSCRGIASDVEEALATCGDEDCGSAAAKTR